MAEQLFLHQDGCDSVVDSEALTSSAKNSESFGQRNIANDQLLITQDDTYPALNNTNQETNPPTGRLSFATSDTYPEREYTDGEPGVDP